MNRNTQEEILEKMHLLTLRVRECISEALAAPSEDEAAGAMEPTWNDLNDLKALADALVALRR